MSADKGTTELRRLEAEALLLDGRLLRGEAHCDGELHVSLGTEDATDARPAYVTPSLPVEVHCHGFGSVDFSDFDTLDLDVLQRHCRDEGVLAIPTLYLHRSALGSFENFMRRYDEARRSGRLPNVVGIALEGPLLASHGGTPAATVWPPDKFEWARLAALGDLGLLYMVMSPDAFAPASELRDMLHSDTPGFEWIIPRLLARGVRPALGHFTKADPSASAECVKDILAMAHAGAWLGSGSPVVTDHLFNDMPLKIKHAFRTSRARAQRDATIQAYDLPNWTLHDMEEIAGPVPAAIMQGAAAGRLAACLNFDGEHVDNAIATRAVQLMGGNAMLMTDRCDSARLAGQALHQEGETGLWYQSNGLVAAGSQPMDRQMCNAREQGFGEAALWTLAAGTAHKAFGLTAVEGAVSFVSEQGLRTAVAHNGRR